MAGRQHLTFPPSHSTLLLLSLLVGCLISGRTATAEEPNEGAPETLELLKEEESVSIAVRHEQPISEAPSNVYIITDEDIRQSGAPDIPTILRRIPGMEVMQTTGADFNVSIRGDNQLAANKLLVMVDGRSIYVDIAGLVHWKLLPVTLPEIKRIEVLKGPASALYGFNAFDGIVNIITKSPEEMKGTLLQFGGGEFGTISSAAVHAGTQGKFGYRLSAGEEQNQQWRNRAGLAIRAYKFNIHTEYATSDVSKISVSSGLVDSNRFDGPMNAATTFAGAPAQRYADVGYERPNFYIRAWWIGYDNPGQSISNPLLANFIQVVGNDLSPNTNSLSNTYNFESQHAVEFGSNNRLAYGVNYRHNTLSGNLAGHFGREDRFGLYLQDEWKPVQRLTVVAGVRYDLQSFINPTVSPRFALIYQLTADHTFRIGASVAYRPPTLLENFLAAQTIITLPPPSPSPQPVPINGSQNLQPEQIISYDVGYQGWFFKHRLRLRTGLFFNHISDLINFGGPRGPGGGALSNGGEADIYGGEIGMDFLVTRWLSGFANYSYQQIHQTFIGPDPRGGPRSKFNAGVRGEWENGFSGEVAYHYYGAATYPIGQAFFAFEPFGVVPPNPRVGSYNLLNIRAGYRFWRQKAVAGYFHEAEVAVSAFNALNDQHKEYPVGDTIGSRVMGWLTLKF